MNSYTWLEYVVIGFGLYFAVVIMILKFFSINKHIEDQDIQ